MAAGSERDPRVVARELPNRALIVALVHAEEDAADGAAAADSLAMELGRRREHTLLTTSASDPSPLDLLLGGADGEGLPGALEGRARLTDIAIQPVDRPFVYLPAGRRPRVMTDLLASDQFASFVERVRERGGTLLLLLPEGQLEEAAIRDLLDGYVALGEAVAEEQPDLRMYGRLQVSGIEEFAAAPVEGPGDDSPADEDAPLEMPTALSVLPDAEMADVRVPDPHQVAGWRRHREPREFPVRRVAVGVGAIAVLLIGWWLIGGALRAPGGAEAEPTMSSPAASGEGTEATDPELEIPALTAAVAEAAVGLAPELPYSVLIASYAARSDAEDRLARLRRGGGGPYFVVPTLIRGVLYYRVFAGARPDAESARALMTGLVESGRKDDVSAWHVRPARLAYLLGAYGTRAEAHARQEAATAAGVPAYTLSAALEGSPGLDSLFQVYAGAYESPVAARALIPLLESAGEDAELIDRRGRQP